VRLRRTAVTVVRIAGILAAFRTEDFRNSKQAWDPLNHDVGAAGDFEVPTAMEATDTCPGMILIEHIIYIQIFGHSIRTSQESHYINVTDTNQLMMFRETIAVYCENHTEHTNPVRASQEMHHLSPTETNRLMLFREIVAVYCEIHTEHTNPVRTSQETHNVSATETNLLMLFRSESESHYN
jgi:hypothetical protein